MDSIGIVSLLYIESIGYRPVEPQKSRPNKRFARQRAIEECIEVILSAELFADQEQDIRWEGEHADQRTLDSISL